VEPRSKIFTSLVNKNAIKLRKGGNPPKKFHNLQNFGKNLMDSPPGFEAMCVYGKVFLD
jgi:hypothetical protein